MGERRESREWVVQLLFQLDLNPTDDLDPVLERFWADKEPPENARAFAERLVRGVRERVAEIDALIQAHLEHWDLARLAVTDRNVIRMAVYEMLHCMDIPPVVSINEAVDIARYFGMTESGRFVNGILDKIRQGLDRPARTGKS